MIALLLPPESGYLHEYTFNPDVRQPEPATDQAATWKYDLDLFRGCIGSDVIVLGNFPQDQVSYTAPDDVGLVPCLLKSTYNLRCMRAKLFDRQAMAVS